MKCCRDSAIKTLSKQECEFGPKLIEEKHPVLIEWIKREIDVQEKILSALKSQKKTDKIESRIPEIQNRILELKQIYSIVVK